MQGITGATKTTAEQLTRQAGHWATQLSEVAPPRPPKDSERNIPIPQQIQTNSTARDGGVGLWVGLHQAGGCSNFRFLSYCGVAKVFQEFLPR